jgi:hypothetical protein
MLGARSRPTVFICYRRDDTQDFADRLYDTLSTTLGDSRVFMDIDSISYGDDFEQTLRDKLAVCSAMLVLIGPAWLAARDRAGARRLDDPADFVRREIEAGLQRPEVRIIPVLAHGAAMPQPAELPDTMTPLARKQALQLNREYFKPGVERLIETLTSTTASPDDDSPGLPGIPQAQALLKQATNLVHDMNRSRDAPGSVSLPAPAPGPTGIQLWYQTDQFKSTLTILALIFFWPAGLVLNLTYAPWSPKTKQAVNRVCVALGALSVLLIAIGAIH